MVRNYVKQKNLTLGQQMFRMTALSPQFTCFMKPSYVTWSGSVQPTEMSAVYVIEINYVLGMRPRVFVRDPLLTRRNGTEKIPHLFPGNDLCLYQPRYREWLAT